MLAFSFYEAVDQGNDFYTRQLVMFEKSKLWPSKQPGGEVWKAFHMALISARNTRDMIKQNDQKWTYSYGRWDLEAVLISRLISQNSHLHSQFLETIF